MPAGRSRRSNIWFGTIRAEGASSKTLSDLFHIAECNLNMHDALDLDGALELARTIMDETYNTHFHVWSFQTLSHHLRLLIDELGMPYSIRRAESDGHFEMAFLLEATGGSFRPPDITTLSRHPLGGGKPLGTPSDLAVRAALR